jgi:tetratricopeptide (TPR) repeat protein
MTGILGDCALKLGDRPRALDYYHRSLDILTALSAKQSNIRFAGNALVMTQHIGDALLIEGKITEAVNWYAKSHQMAVQMSSNDPNDDIFQRLLITTSGQLGHALVENGQVEEGMKYLNFARVKLEASPSQIPLIAVYKGILHQWVGEVSERKGKINDAVNEYSTSQTILHAVLAGGANDLRNQVFYVSSTDRLGAAMLKLGNATEAQEQYEDSRKLLEPLNQSNPDNMEVLYALAETYAGEGSVFAKLAQDKTDSKQNLANWNSASEWFQKSLNVWSKVPHPSRFSTSWMEVRMPNEVARQLAECRAQIAHVASHSPDSAPKV